MIKVSGIILVIMSMQDSNASKRMLEDNNDLYGIQQELGIYCKEYHSSQQAKSNQNDDWKVELRHPEAKRRKKTSDWPVVNRTEFNHMYKDTENQIETIDGLLLEYLRRIAPIYEINVVDIDDNLEFLSEQARILLEDEGFSNQERCLKTLKNFRNYLNKKKPDNLIVEINLSGFLKYLEEQNYKIPENYKKDALKYLEEYFFQS